ncbi:hypothetical protein EYF80_020656 [Liparis tanakae]|uniref:Uncharacterized protein n=1 Tax=Liparis tanakae TaxID=230148 RepID=A0A4Z2HVT1_9TELE|nr:hypothetical protein EYF80_020656 [Liparis tanakae]
MNIQETSSDAHLADTCLSQPRASEGLTCLNASSLLWSVGWTLFAFSDSRSFFNLASSSLTANTRNTQAMANSTSIRMNSRTKNWSKSRFKPQ